MKTLLAVGCGIVCVSFIGLPSFGVAGEPTAPSAADAPVITLDAQSVNSGIRSYTVTCGYQKGPNKLEVLLPDDYTTGKKYPVVYMLPVNMGTDGQWGSSIVEAKKANLQNAYHLIFVAPAYDTQPWFGDNPARPEIRQNSYMMEVVLPFVDREFSTLAEARGRMLIGFSKSGLGAWQLFLMHLDVFDQVAIFDSYQGQPTQEQWNTWGFADTYGTRENFDKYDPPKLLDQQKQVLQSCPRRITLVGGRTRSARRRRLVSYKARRLQDPAHLHPRIVHAAQLVQWMVAARGDRNGIPRHRFSDQPTALSRRVRSADTSPSHETECPPHTSYGLSNHPIHGRSG